MSASVTQRRTTLRSDELEQVVVVELAPLVS